MNYLDFLLLTSQLYCSNNSIIFLRGTGGGWPQVFWAENFKLTGIKFQSEPWVKTWKEPCRLCSELRTEPCICKWNEPRKEPVERILVLLYGNLKVTWWKPLKRTTKGTGYKKYLMDVNLKRNIVISSNATCERAFSKMALIKESSHWFSSQRYYFDI